MQQNGRNIFKQNLQEKVKQKMPNDLVGQWNFDRHSFESSCLIHERARHGENKVLARK